MSLYDFRESKGGDFFHDDSARGTRGAGGPGDMPFTRFARAQGGVGLDLWDLPDADADQVAILDYAGLLWPVDSRPVLVPTDEQPQEVQGYRVLVRPDTGQPMTVVTTAYSVAENRWVVDAALNLARAHRRDACLVAAVGFGRNNERTLFAVRVEGDDDTALVLLVHNTHGGEGAVRFRLVEADRKHEAVLALGLDSASLSVPHVGNIGERLDRLRYRRMVEEYLDESRPAWERLSDALWTPRHSKALIGELWPQAVQPPKSLDGITLTHPQDHLLDLLAGCSDPATAYRRLCDYLDNQSEARERGDFTKDRDERLALGAGLRHKERAWCWITNNT